jgi:hypothetical protein
LQLVRLRVTDKPASNESNDLGYPINVVIVRAANRNLVTGMSAHLLTRERIRKAFEYQPLSGVPEVHTVMVEPGVVFDWNMFQLQYDVQSLVVRCLSRERKGVI